MNYWLAMILALPLVLDWRGNLKQRLSTRRMRVWLIMVGSGLCAYTLPALPANAAPPIVIGLGYVLIDAIAGYAVLRPKPMGCAQRTIGAVFACMVAFDIGFFLSSNGANVSAFVGALRMLGWVQLACLVTWGGYNVGKAAVRDIRDNRAASAYRGVAR